VLDHLKVLTPKQPNGKYPKLAFNLAPVNGEKLINDVYERHNNDHPRRFSFMFDRVKNRSGAAGKSFPSIEARSSTTRAFARYRIKPVELPLDLPCTRIVRGCSANRACA
jgi:hypothetical protein